ncbi:unnamed protein product [Nesidiocoris tenuis]|nr:bZIP Maf transcription factor [Nesidiocoris tenuis]CAA9993174.1 unnamed protein product [Nesidiocoris tenuis]CAA9993176.1 unnamed protein product [Nesidiocoris tenuis]
MENEDTNHLAESYVADFVLDHLEHVAVKKEAAPEMDQQQRIQSQMLQCNASAVISQTPPPQQPPPPHLLTPPGHHSADEYGPPPPHGAMSVLHHSNLMYPDTPGTPPDTPPESNSPHSPMVRSFQMDPLLANYPRGTIGAINSSGLPEEVAWIVANGANTLRQEPLDLRPNGNSELTMEEWNHLQQNQQQQNHHMVKCQSSLDFHHPCMSARQHPPSVRCPDDDMSVMSPMSQMGSTYRGPKSVMSVGVSDCGSVGPRGPLDDLISDDLLMCLSVRELNKRLHGYPRDEVVRLKQKRRTLKNRGYAQNCRSKRLHQRHELESMNRTLQTELHRLKVEHARVLSERDMYKHRFDILKKKMEFAAAAAVANSSAGSETPVGSSDLYERFQ